MEDTHGGGAFGASGVRISIPGGLKPDEHARAVSAARRVEADPQGFVDRYRAEFGNEFNADNASELLPEYSQSPETRTRYHRAVHQVTRWIRDEAFGQALARPIPETGIDVIFTAGGSGSGKSTAVAEFKGQPFLVYDTTLSVFDGAKKTIEQVLATGRRVRIRYLHRDIAAAYRDGVLPRAMGKGRGRTVSVTSQVRSHEGARDTILRLADQYKDNPRVDIELFESAAGKLVPSTIERMREYDYTGAREQLNAILDEAFRKGRISRLVYDVSRGT